MIIKTTLLESGSIAHCRDCSWNENLPESDYFKVKVIAIKHSKYFNHVVHITTIHSIKYKENPILSINVEVE